MKITKLLQSTAYHEAGHAAAGFRVGMKVKSVSIVPDGGSLGRHIHQPYFQRINPAYDDSPRAQRRLENAAFVCLAGPAAQRRFNPKGFRRYHAKGDWDQCVDLLAYLSADADVLSAYFNLIEVQARKFVALRWSQIEHLANALLSEHELDGQRAARLLLSGPMEAR